jgi:hypothetical protein
VFIGGNVTAGNGRRIDIIGKAGGEGFTANLDTGGAIVITPDGSSAWGVQVSTDAGQPNALRADGGTVAIDAQGTDVSLRVNSFSDFSRARCRAIGTRLPPHRRADLGGEQHRQGRQHLGARAQCGGRRRRLRRRTVCSRAWMPAAPPAAAASTSRPPAPSPWAATPPGGQRHAGGNGGIVKVVAGDTLRAYGSLSARGGAEGGNGGFIETSAPHFDLTGVRVDASAPAGTRARG